MIKSVSDSPLVQVKNLGIRFRMWTPTTLKRLLITTMRRFSADQNGDGNEFWALREVSFAIQNGDRLGVIGDNGAGKDTLLRLIAGIYPATEGTVICNGTIYPLLQLGLGFNHEITGQENCYLAMSFFGMGRRQVTPLLEQIFSFSELENFRHQPMKTYSNGMIGRLAFTIATSVRPDILVLDEVFASGDIHWTQRAIKRLEKRIENSRGLIMVSHSMDQIGTYCNKCLWLDRGRVMGFGGTELVDRYKRFIATRT